MYGICETFLPVSSEANLSIKKWRFLPINPSATILLINVFKICLLLTSRLIRKTLYIPTNYANFLLVNIILICLSITSFGFYI